MKFLPKITVIALAILSPLLLQGEEFQVKIIESAEDLPENFCTHWEKGDYLLSNGKILAIIGGVPRAIKGFLNYPEPNAMGNIISFVPSGKDLMSNINIGSPVMRIDKKIEFITYQALNPIEEPTAEGAFAFEATAHHTTKNGNKVRVKTTYLFSSDEGRVDIISSITNTGENEFENMNYFLYSNALSAYGFTPFHRERHPDHTFRVYQKMGYYLAQLNQNSYPYTEEPLPGKLAPNETHEIRYIFLLEEQSQNILRKIYHILNIPAEEVSLTSRNFTGDAMEVIIEDVFSSTIFFRSWLRNPFSQKILLPKGAYKVRAHFFPAVGEVYLAVGKREKNSCDLQDLSHGQMKVKIRDSKDEFVPGKVTFIGLDPTKTPYFKPEDPILSGRGWEPVNNSIYPDKKGLEIKIPVGTYLIYASRGLEYSKDQKIVEIAKDEKQELIFRIKKVVETQNLISIDPHMHTHKSDGRVGIAERIKSVVAEGVDVAVASDHNYITDYYPTLKKLGLNKYLAVITGNEVSTAFVGHFNTYPLKYRPEEEGNGAIWPLTETASPLFKATRKKDPEAIVQVNHPHAGYIGYFYNYSLDEESASFALDGFDTSFDVIEVLNGSRPLWVGNSRSIKDWLNLLNRGYYYPIVGSSDAHVTDMKEPGYARTYVLYKGAKGDNLNLNELTQAMKSGRSFISTGPIVEFTINGDFTFGDTLTATNGDVDMVIKVQSAPWIALDEVRLIMNGEKKIIFPVKVQDNSSLKFQEEIRLRLKRDTYLAVEVLGKRSLFPVLQQSSPTGLHEHVSLPYALTNPIFVDVDGNDKFDSLYNEKIKLIPELQGSEESKSGYE